MKVKQLWERMIYRQQQIELFPGQCQEADNETQTDGTTSEQEILPTGSQDSPEEHKQ